MDMSQIMAHQERLVEELHQYFDLEMLKFEIGITTEQDFDAMLLIIKAKSQRTRKLLGPLPAMRTQIAYTIGLWEHNHV